MMRSLLFLVRIKRRIWAILLKLYANILMRVHGIQLGKNVLITYPPYIFKYRSSMISIGNRVRIHGSLFQNPVCGSAKMVLATYSPQATILIDDYAAISCSTICAYNSVRIGKYVQIGAGCQITDTDFHPLDWELRRQKDQIKLAKSLPVEIEDDVWLGAEVMVLKGVTIGRGSVVAARSVVTKSIPPYSLAAGTPAKVISSLKAK